MDLQYLLDKELEIEFEVRKLQITDSTHYEVLVEELAKENKGQKDKPTKPHEAAAKKPTRELGHVADILNEYQRWVTKTNLSGNIPEAEFERAKTRLLHLQGRMERLRLSPSCGQVAEELGKKCTRLLEIILMIQVGSTANLEESLQQLRDSHVSTFDDASDVEEDKRPESNLPTENLTLGRTDDPHKPDENFQFPTTTNILNTPSSVPSSISIIGKSNPLGSKFAEPFLNSQSTELNVNPDYYYPVSAPQATQSGRYSRHGEIIPNPQSSISGVGQINNSLGIIHPPQSASSPPKSRINANYYHPEQVSHMLLTGRESNIVGLEKNPQYLNDVVERRSKQEGSVYPPSQLPNILNNYPLSGEQLPPLYPPRRPEIGGNIFGQGNKYGEARNIYIEPISAPRAVPSGCNSLGQPNVSFEFPPNTYPQPYYTPMPNRSTAEFHSVPNYYQQNRHPRDDRGLSRCGILYDASSDGMPVEEFIFRLEHTARIRGLTDRMIMEEITQVIKGKALDLYWYTLRRSPVLTWARFRDDLRARFQDRRTEYEIRRRVESRKQHRKEPFLEFYHNILALTAPAAELFPEREILHLLRRNMRPGLQVALADRNIYTVSDLVQRSVAIEDTWARVGHDPDQGYYNRSYIHEMELAPSEPAYPASSNSYDVNQPSWYDQMDDDQYSSHSAQNREVLPSSPLAIEEAPGNSPICAVGPAVNASPGNTASKVTRFSVPPPPIQNPANIRREFQKTFNPPKDVCWNCYDSGHFFRECLKPLHLFCFKCGCNGVRLVNCSNCRPGNLKTEKPNPGNLSPRNFPRTRAILDAQPTNNTTNRRPNTFFRMQHPSGTSSNWRSPPE